MSLIVRKIIQQKGVSILSQPQVLAEELRTAGSKERNIHRLLLVLSVCPGLVPALTSGTPTRTELHNMIAHITRDSGLSVHVVRSVVGELMLACNVVTPESLVYGVWPGEPLPGGRLPDAQTLAAQIIPEDALVRMLAKELESGSDDTGVFNRLNALADQGNAEAAYRLGLHFRKGNGPEDQKHAQQYFSRAAALGYGPAHGALADCLRMDIRKIGQVVKHVSHPGAICGAEGRRWKKVGDALLQYQKANLDRINSMIRYQLLSMLTVLVLLFLFGSGVGITAAVSVQAVGLMWTVFARFRKHYLSCAVPAYLMIASWALVLLEVLIKGGAA